MYLKDKVNCVIFDFDGVLVNSVDIKYSAFYDIFIDEFSNEEVAKKTLDHHIQYHTNREETIKYGLSLLGENYIKSYLNKMLNNFSCLVKQEIIDSPEIDYATEILKYLKNNWYDLYIASGTPTSELYDIVKGKGWIDIFEPVEEKNYFNEKRIFGTPKNKYENIQIILNQEMIEPNNVVLIGDTSLDYKASKKTNINFIGFKNKNQFPKDVKVIDSLKEIGKIL